VQKFKGKPFIILGVNVDGDLGTMKHSETEQKLTWPSIWDAQHVNANTYKVSALPTVFLVDYKGRVATPIKAGLPDEKNLENLIERLLAEAEKDSAQAKGD
jgi:hypothetical protein